MYIVTEEDRVHLKRCVALAAEAAAAGDQPFGSVLVDASGKMLFEDRNRTSGGDQTRHPEFAIARWAAEHLSPTERASCTVYTSGEHCPMCSAAQFRSWRSEFGIGGRLPISILPINAVAPDIPVAGPDPELSQEIRALLERLARRSGETI